MAQWYAIVVKGTNELYSIGTVIADPLPDKYEAIELGNSFDANGKQWDTKTRQFITAKDPTVEGFITQVSTLPELQKLTSQEKLSLMDKLRKFLLTGII